MRRVRAFMAFVAVAGGFLISSCDKHSIDLPQSNDPVFRANGTIDSDEFELVAGDNNAFMFTSMQTENNVPVFTGELSNGDLAIEIDIYDGLVDIPDHSIINSLPSQHAFSRISTSPIATLSKDAFPNADMINQVTWTVDGGAPVLNDMVITEPGKYQVCAEIIFWDGSSSTLCSELILGYKRHANFHIKHFLNQNGSLTAYVDDPQVAIERIRWYIDNEYVSDASQMLFTGLSPENHILRAEVLFVNGVKRSKNMIVDGSLSGKFIDDLTFFETGTLSLINRDFNIRVKLTENGTVFTSDRMNNSLNAVTFEDISYFGKDGNGNDVFKVKAHINANVTDVQNVNGSRELSFDTTFGIAIPAH